MGSHKKACNHDHMSIVGSAYCSLPCCVLVTILVKAPVVDRHFCQPQRFQSKNHSVLLQFLPHPLKRLTSFVCLSCTTICFNFCPHSACLQTRLSPVTLLCGSLHSNHCFLLILTWSLRLLMIILGRCLILLMLIRLVTWTASFARISLHGPHALFQSGLLDILWKHQPIKLRGRVIPASPLLFTLLIFLAHIRVNIIYWRKIALLLLLSS